MFLTTALDIQLPVAVRIDAGNVGGPSAGLAFALEQLGRDLDDLASRAQERAGDLAQRTG